LTKKKQSKRTAKQGAKKSSSRSGVAPTLHEIPAVAPVQPQAASPPAEIASAAKKPAEAPQVEAKQPEAPPAEAKQPDAPPAEAKQPEALPAEAKQPEAPSAEAQQSEAPPAEAKQPETPPAEAKQPEALPDEAKQPEAPIDAHRLSAPQPIHPDPTAVDIAAEPGSHTSIAAAVTEQLAHPLPAPVADAPRADTLASPVSVPTPVPTSFPTSLQTSGPNSAPTSIPTSITNDIPMPATIASSPPAQAPPEQPGQVQKTIYDITAIEISPTPQSIPTPVSTAPSLNPQSLGSLTRSKSSSEVSRGLPGGNNEYKWRPPIDYFGASASAFSSSFSGSNPRDLNAVRGSADAPIVSKSTHGVSAPTPVSQTPTTPGQVKPQVTAQPAQAQPKPIQSTDPVSSTKVYESTTDASALSPKMAKFVENLRERELTTASGASAPTLQPMEATSVDVAPIQAPPLNAPMKLTPVVRAEGNPPELKPETKQAKANQPPIAAQTSRDLAPFAKAPESTQPEPKAPKDQAPLAPKSSSQVTELRESIIAPQGDGNASDDWHPVAQKKPPRQTDPQFAAELGDLKKSDKQKAEPERHLTLEEMAAMDPDLALAPQTPQQQSIRRLKTKAKGGIHAEIYIPIYIACLGLGWVTEQSAAAGTFRDAGQRIDSALELIAPKPLADNFMAGVNAFDDREIKLHPFNPNKPRNIMQVLLSRIQAFCSGLSSAFGRIPPTLAASSTNPLAEILILLSYLAVLSLSLMIYFKFKRSTSWIIADFILLPIGLVAASTVITPVFIAVLSMSASLAAGFLPNTIVTYTTIAIILSVCDMARRTFLGRKQSIVRD
jgi:hypothetical protein